jgi:hypothetical protein
MITLPILAAASDADAGAALAGGVALFSVFFMIVGLVLAIGFDSVRDLTRTNRSPLLEIARVLVRFYQIARLIASCRHR